MDKISKPAPTTVEKKELPSVGDLFKQAWDVLASQYKRLILLWLYSVAAYIVVALTCVVLIGGYILTRVTSQGLPLSHAPQILTSILQPATVVPIITIASLFFITATIIGLVYTASAILTFADEKKETSTWNHIKSSIQYAWPLFITGIIVGFLAIGGLLFFFIPYIIIMTTLCFYTYTVILEKKQGMAAIQMSAALVFQNFLAIFLRLLLLWVAYIALSATIAALFSRSGQGESTAGLLQFIGSIFLNMYSMAYLYTLYKQARSVYVEKNVSIAWMWVVALLGWIILAVLGIFGYRAFMAQRRKAIEQQRKYDNQMQEFQNQENPFHMISPPKAPLNI